MQLKSQEGPPGQPLESNTVLCTADRTYSLRQVSTSNTVYVVHPTIAPNEGFHQSDLEAIAQSNSTLELQLTKWSSAIPHIKAALPTYTSTGHYGSREAVSKGQLFANIPLSDSECEQGWTQLACFELEDPPRALVPSDSTKLQLWQTMLGSATAMGIGLTSELDEDALSSIVSSNSDQPSQLYEALLRSMANETAASGEIMLDETKCATTVGQILLRKRTVSSQGSVPLQKFITDWADLLPEQWRKRAEISLLEGYYRLENSGKDIAFVENEASSGAKDVAPVEAKSTLGAKRKWHEKFRASKKSA